MIKYNQYHNQTGPDNHRTNPIDKAGRSVCCKEKEHFKIYKNLTTEESSPKYFDAASGPSINSLS